MKWFRYYHNACRDPKIQNLRPELFKFWVNFLCIASAQDDRGRVPSEDHVSFGLGLGKALTKRWLSELEALALLHRGADGSLTPHNWEDRQPESDDSAKRQRSRRQKTFGKPPSEMSRDMSRDIPCDMSGTCAPRVRADSDSEEEIPPDPLFPDPYQPTQDMGPEYVQLGLDTEAMYCDSSWCSWVTQQGRYGHSADDIRAAIRLATNKGLGTTAAKSYAGTVLDNARAERRPVARPNTAPRIVHPEVTPGWDKPFIPDPEAIHPRFRKAVKA